MEKTNAIRWTKNYVCSFVSFMQKEKEGERRRERKGRGEKERGKERSQLISNPYYV